MMHAASAMSATHPAPMTPIAKSHAGDIPLASLGEPGTVIRQLPTEVAAQASDDGVVGVLGMQTPISQSQLSALLVVVGVPPPPPVLATGTPLSPQAPCQ